MAPSEARVGQQGALTCVWADKGARPAAPQDLGHERVYVFGAICPSRGAGAALALPCANAEMMSLRLIEISRQAAPGAHAVAVLDGAGWHRQGGCLTVPDNITLLHQPPYSPKLDPVGDTWQFPRQNHLSNRVFESCDAILTARCEAWQALVNTPGRIRSIGTRTWAKVR